jgi:hypothetical protein
MKLAGLIAIAGLALWVPPLEADLLQISYDVDGGPLATCSVVPANLSASCGGFVVAGLDIDTLTSVSNSPGIPLGASLITKLSLTNNSTLTHTLELFVAAQGYDIPVAPPNMAVQSHIGGTVSSGSANLTFATCIDRSNSLAPPTTLSFCSAGIFLGSPFLSPGVGSFTDTQSTVVTVLAAPYSVSQRLELILDPAASINLTNTLDSLASPVPEPSSFLLILTAVAVAILVRRAQRQVH